MTQTRKRVKRQREDSSTSDGSYTSDDSSSSEDSMRHVTNRRGHQIRRPISKECAVPMRHRTTTTKRRSRKRRRPSSDGSRESTSTSGESRSTASSSSRVPKARKTRRFERRHWVTKGKHRSAMREKRRKQERDDEVRVLPPRQAAPKRDKRRKRESDDDVQVLPPRQMAQKRVVIQQKRVVQPSEKCQVSGPPFPYPPSAGLRVPKEEFVRDCIIPRRAKRKELDKSRAPASTPQEF